MEPNHLNNQGLTNMFKHHYNALTAENSMKPQYMWPTRDNRTFGGADALVDWAEQNNIYVIGHTLVWHDQSPPWLNRAGNEVLTRQQAMENMKYYIDTVAGRYKGRLLAWDVVNEVFYNNVTDAQLAQGWRGGLRSVDLSPTDPGSAWYRAFANGAAAGEDGSDYIYYSFVFTRLADPTAILYYNDFNEEFPNKREAIARMVEELNERWRNDERYDDRLLIEGICMQSHYNQDTNLSDVRASIERFIRTGAKVSITELDITIGSSRGNEYLNAAEERRQADMYRQLFGYYLEFSDNIERVSFWGKADNMSWRGDRHPLIFDRRFRAKEAFHAIVDTAGNR
jgi:endo-1,4-beta-xylanase